MLTEGTPKRDVDIDKDSDEEGIPLIPFFQLVDDESTDIEETQRRESRSKERIAERKKEVRKRRKLGL